MRDATRSSIKQIFLSRAIQLTMASSSENDSDYAPLSEDSGDENSFDGENSEGENTNDDSDLDFDDLESEEDDTGAAENEVRNHSSDEDDNEELRWSDQLSDFAIPDFVAASGVAFELPDVPIVYDFFF